MRDTFRSIASRGIAAALLFSIAACGSPPTITPASTKVAPRAAATFSAMGGSAPYQWSIATNASGASIDASGNYVAGPKPDVTDVVQVVDADGKRGMAAVSVGAGVSIAPSTGVAVWPFGAQAFTASGGSGQGYAWSLATHESGGAVDATGAYRAGPTSGHDVVVATDPLGNSARVDVLVRANLDVTPQYTLAQSGQSIRFAATGGKGPYTWKLSVAPSGGTMGADGSYTAGATAGADVIEVSDGDGETGYASVLVAASGGGFQPAPHAVEHVRSEGGPVYAHPRLVTIIYANDPARKEIEALGDYLPRSNWLAQVGAEYGIGPGVNLNVELAQPAPPSISDDEIQSNIAAWIDDHTLPGPDGEYVYAMYIPKTTQETLNGAALCAYSGGGYHFEAQANDGTPFAYAVISVCPGEPAGYEEIAASHEFIEAVTDPFPETAPAYILPYGPHPSDPWALLGGELGDLCAYAPSVMVDGHSLTAVYSNAAAAAGGAPCVPLAEPYFTVSAAPGVQTIPAGGSATFTLTAWSSAPVAPWPLYAAPSAGIGDCPYFKPNVTLGQSTVANGDSTTLTVDVDPGTRAGSCALVYLESHTQTENIVSVVGVYVR